jgi:hypothetical protein
MKYTLLVVLTLIAVVAFSGQPAWSQGETGTIAGTVTDSTGAVIPGASVTAKSLSTSAERTVMSRTDGSYLLLELQPGLYDITVTSGNFAPFKARAEVTVGGKVSVDAQLAVSGTTQRVEVVGQGGAAVNTQSQELSQLVDSTQIDQLPSLNRNPYDLVSLSGNVSNGDSTSNGGAPNSLDVVGQSLTGRGVGYSINGQRESGTEILLDGVENVGIFTDNAGQPVPTDSIQEFSIITNNFGADYGRASGGIVNVDTKSGTNSIHGSAFEYNRLSAYTANTFANVLADAPKGSYVRNDFGYTLGGPFIKDKLFGFFSEEFVRVRSNSSQVEDILDPGFISMLPSNVQAYFSKFGTGAPAPVATITAGQLAAAGIFSTPNFPEIDGTTVVPASTPVFDTVHFTAPFDAGGGEPQNTYDLLGRVDYNFSDKTTMFFRLARYRESDQAGAISFTPYSQYNVAGANFGDSELFSLNHVFSPNLLSSSKVSFTRFDVTNSFNTALTSTPNLYLSTSTSAQPTDPVGNNTIQLPGLENTDDGSGGLPFGGPQNTLQFSQDVAWTKGKHSMHFGGEFTYIQLNFAYGAYAQANEVLGSDVGPSLANLVDSSGLMSGGAFAAPILQFAARVNAEGALPCATDIFDNPIVTPACTVTPPLPVSPYARSYRYKDWDLYAGDSFKITHRLTLNYALRYEHFGVQHNNHQNLDSNFFDGPGSFPESIRTGAVEFTTASSVGQFWAPRWGTAAPRVGFAYDIFGDGKTSLRGGFGISYERNFGNVTYNASFNPPVSAVLSSVCSSNSSGVIATCGQFVTNNDLGPLGLPGSPTALTPVELRDDDAHINVAQTQFWSLAVDRELAPNTLLSISYSGAHSIHLYDLNNINLLGAGQALLGDPLVTDPACPFSNPTTSVPTCYTRLNSQYTNINDRGSNGSGAYDGLNIKFQTTNFRHTGLTFVANYTWSHSLDDLSSTFSDSLTQGSLGFTDYQRPTLDWGSSDFDVRHRIVLSPIWQTPWYKEGTGFLTQALGGWSVSGIVTARSGIPFSIYDESYLLNFYVIPRLTPASAITQFHTGTPVFDNQQGGSNTGNEFFALNVPPPAALGPNNPALGISDFGPFPADMSRRNAFRGPGAWNTDLSIGKNFKLTERFGLEFRAEAFNAFNHHNFYVNPFSLDYTGPTTTGLQVIEEKGGLGQGALGGNHDERRFGQFSLKLKF